MRVVGLSFLLLVLARGVVTELLLKGDEVYESDILEPKSLLSRSVETPTKIMQKPGRESFFEIFATIEDFKDESSVWTGSDSSSRKTLSKMHYLVLPMWWQDESPKAPANLDSVRAVLDATVQYYSDMSFGKHSITYEILTQTILGVSKSGSSLNDSAAAARDHIAELGRIEFVDYTGVILLYNHEVASEPYGLGGWGSVNGNFVWMSLSGTFDVLRHEIGHNYGHPHHKRNTYEWRVDRGKEAFGYDSFDMMSGGNGFAISDLAAASKWLYNWVQDEAVILMQPEGPTKTCPTCVSQVSGLVLSPFDARNNVQPSSSNPMAIHIPLVGEVGDWTNNLYSYWLSYRHSEGRANGLSVHLTELRLQGMFGATYESLNYDINGDTTTMNDSFVIAGTCYVVSPAGWMMDKDPNVSKVQPVVCVDSIDSGTSITVSVSFLDTENPPIDKVELASSRQLGCTAAGLNSELSLDMASGKSHLLHYRGSGQGGRIDFSFFPASGDATMKAYFYDSYPQAFMAFGAPAGYQAYRSLDAVNNDFASLVYQTEYDETYILVVSEPETNSGTSLRVQSLCTINSCSAGTYLDGEVCVSCPDGSVSSHGALSVDACTSCTDDGFKVSHPSSPHCLLSDRMVDGGTTANEWRFLAPTSLSASGWSWDIQEINLYSSTDCSGAPIDLSSGTAFSSGSAGDEFSWGPGNAFGDNNKIWGGRADDRGLLFVGVSLSEDVTVKCMKINHNAGRHVSDFWVQARSNGIWENVWVAKHLYHGENVIRFETSFVVPTRAPTERPPTPTPTNLRPSPPTTANSGGQFCFSASNIVEIEGKGTISMGELKIGDLVRVDDNHFSMVHGFYHLEPNVEASYLQLHFDNLDQPLEISGNHLVFANNIAKPAAEVKVGDRLDKSTVTGIETIQSRGVYAPATYKGTIVVSGVRTSTYSSHVPYAAVNEHVGAHWLLTYHRMICRWNFSLCRQETYFLGVSNWIAPVARLAYAIGELGIPLQIVVTLTGLPLILTMFLLEQAFLFSKFALCALVLGVFALHTYNTRNRETKVTKEKKACY